MNTNINLAGAFIQFLVLLFSLTVHESAHAWTAARLGDPTGRLQGRISLNPLVHADLIGTIVFPLLAIFGGIPLIGWAKPVPVNVRMLRNPRRDYMVVAAAGPLANLALALVAAIVLRVVLLGPDEFGRVLVSGPLARIALAVLGLNLLLAIFNLIPVPPLDGSSILAGLLPPRAAYQFNNLRPYGFIVLYALMLTGVLGYLFVGPYTLLLSWLLQH